MYPPSISTPLPEAMFVSMKATDGDTRSKICVGFSGAGVGLGVRVAVGKGVAVGSGVAVGEGVAVGTGVSVGTCVEVAVAVGSGVDVGTGVAVAVAVLVGAGEAVGVLLEMGAGWDVAAVVGWTGSEHAANTVMATTARIVCSLPNKFL